jgi:hypothetical protein
MFKFLSLIPSLFGIIRRGKVLATLAQSKTTKAQYTAILIAGVLLAAVGYFVPQVADNDVAVALIVLIVPVISRLLLFRQKPNADNDIVMLAKVQQSDDARDWWEPWHDVLRIARELGYERGVDYDGAVWDVTTGERTGETIRIEADWSGALGKLFSDKFGTQDSTSGATVSGVSLPQEDSTDNGQ